MADLIPAAQVVAAFAVGAFLASMGWVIVLGFSPRRRGRHEPAVPELVAEPAAPAPPESAAPPEHTGELLAPGWGWPEGDGPLPRTWLT